MRIEDLQVYQKLCDLHLRVCDLSAQWPRDERFELTSQVRRSSNSSPANLAEKHSDRHLRNKIEGVNRARGEALETIHHLYMAMRRGLITGDVYEQYADDYHECVRMLNGMERTLEKRLPQTSRRWPSQSSNSEPQTLNPEP